MIEDHLSYIGSLLLLQHTLLSFHLLYNIPFQHLSLLNGNFYNNLPSNIVACIRNLKPFPVSSRREHGANITFHLLLPLLPLLPPSLQVMPHNQIAATHSALPSISNFIVQSIVSFIFILLYVYNILTFFYSQLHLKLLSPL